MEVEKIVSIQWNAKDGQYVVETKWRGLGDYEISFEPFEELFRQIPRMLLLYLEVFEEKQNDLYQAFWKKKKVFIKRVLKAKKIVWSFTGEP